MSGAVTFAWSDVGDLGVMHLPRYWQKTQLRRVGLLAGNSFQEEQVLDFSLLNGLGLGIVQPGEFLYGRDRTYAEFEAWIVATLAGVPGADLVARLNDMVRDYWQQPHPTYPLAGFCPQEPVLSAQDLAFWQEHGYVVVSNAISPEQCRASEQVVWDHLGMRRDDPSTWYGAQHMFWVDLFQHPLLNANRQSARIRTACAQLWGTDAVWPTVDRLSLNRPQPDGYDVSGPSRLHWDVSLAMPMPFGIQGLLYLNDTSAEQGAFRCVPGFQHRLEQWLADVPAGQNPREIDLEHLGAQPIPGKAGDLVLWHQALPHGSGVNRAHYPRVVQYIRYAPGNLGVHRDWR